MPNNLILFFMVCDHLWNDCEAPIAPKGVVTLVKVKVTTTMVGHGHLSFHRGSRGGGDFFFVLFHLSLYAYISKDLYQVLLGVYLSHR